MLAMSLQKQKRSEKCESVSKYARGTSLFVQIYSEEDSVKPTPLPLANYPLELVFLLFLCPVMSVHMVPITRTSLAYIA